MVDKTTACQSWRVLKTQCTSVTLPNLVLLDQTVQAWAPRVCLSRSLTVIKSDTVQSGTYELLLVIHNKYGPIS